MPDFLHVAHDGRCAPSLIAGCHPASTFILMILLHVPVYFVHLAQSFKTASSELFSEERLLTQKTVHPVSITFVIFFASDEGQTILHARLIFFL